VLAFFGLRAWVNSNDGCRAAIHAARRWKCKRCATERECLAAKRPRTERSTERYQTAPAGRFYQIEIRNAFVPERVSMYPHRQYSRARSTMNGELHCAVERSLQQLASTVLVARNAVPFEQCTSGANMANDERNSDQRGARPTTAQLRDAIPSRRTPGKSSARDPAMASFDTDDEAAGRPAGAHEVHLALSEEHGAPAKYPEGTGERATGTSTGLIIAALSVILGLIAVLALIN
jgi:hypothetical protein